MDAWMKSDDLRFSVTEPSQNASVAGSHDSIAPVMTYSKSEEKSYGQ